MPNATDILNRLNDDDIDWMISVGARRAITPDEVVVHEGRPTESVMFVLDGTFSVTVGMGRPLATLSTGDVIGEMSFLDRNPPSATVTALTPGFVFALAKATLAEKMACDLKFAARFYSAIGLFLTQRLRHGINVLHGAQPQTSCTLDDTGCAANATGERFLTLARNARETVVSPLPNQDNSNTASTGR